MFTALSSTETRRSSQASASRRPSTDRPAWKMSRDGSRRRPSEEFNADVGPAVECAIYTWGCGSEFRLGTGDEKDKLAPGIVMHTRCTVRSVACGSMHTILLIAPGSRVFTWGEGQHGQLGHDTGNNVQSFQPALVTTLKNLQIIQVGAGGNSSFALTSDTVLYSWGDNSFGQLGLGNGFKSSKKIFTPTEVSSHWDATEMQYRKIRYSKVVMGKRHTAAIDKNLHLFVWGDNSCGQLGHGDRANRNTPVRVHSILDVKQVALGCRHSAAVDERGYLWTWGDAGEGRLGHGVLYQEEKLVTDNVITKTRKKIDMVLEPKRVEFFLTKGLTVQSVACGERFTVALAEQGSVWTWGAGVFGQLGRGRDNLSSEIPERIAEWPEPTPEQSLLLARQSMKVTAEDGSSPSHRDLGNGTPKASILARRTSEATSVPGSGGRPMKSSVLTDSFWMDADVPLDAQAWKLADETHLRSADHSFQHIVAGPYSAMAIAASGEVFAWGRGSNGIIGVGSEEDSYQPMLIFEQFTSRDILQLVTGDKHALLVAVQGRHDLWDLGYNFHQLANTDELVSLTGEQSSLIRKDANDSDGGASTPVPPQQLEAKRPGTQHQKLHRFGPTPMFNQVVGISDSGNVIIEQEQRKNNEPQTVRKEVALADIAGTNPMSLKEVCRELQTEYHPVVPDADAFLQVEGWDLLDDPTILSNQGTHHLLESATPADVRAVMNQWREEGSGQPAPAIRSAAESPLPLVRQRTAQITLRQAMAVEDTEMFTAHHEKVVHTAKHRVVYDHNRKPAGSKSCRTESSARLPAGNGRDTIPCSAVAGKADRDAGPIGNEVPGPGQYDLPRPQHFSDPQQASIVRPCGIGISLTLKEKFIGETKSTFMDHSTQKFEIVVKEVFPGGAVDIGNKSTQCNIAPGDVIYRIEDYVPKDLHEARVLLTGTPNTIVRVTYRHKDKAGTGPQMRVGLRRSYIGKKPSHLINAAYPTPGGCMGLGLKAPRFRAQGSDATDGDLLNEEQEQAILAIIRRLQEEHTKTDLDFLKHRHAMVPALAGLKTVLEETLRLYPEWEEDLRQGPALVRLFKKHGFIDGNNLGDNKNNPWNGPTTYTPHNTAAHNWTEDGKLVSRNVTLANTTGALTWRPDKNKMEAAKPEPATEEEIYLQAQKLVLGRLLEEGEFHRLSSEKQRHLRRAVAVISRERGGGGPGPASYDPGDYDCLGGSRVAFARGRAGHHIKGYSIGGRSQERQTVEVLPGPGQYRVFREGLNASGDFMHKRGMFQYKPDYSPAKMMQDYGGAYEAPSCLSSTGPSEARKTMGSSAPIIQIKGRDGLNFARRVEEGLTIDPLTREWVPGTPGPGAYTPRPPETTRNFTMFSRDGLLCDKMRVTYRMAWDPVEMEWFNPEAGPETYSPKVTKDGKHVHTGGAANSFSMSGRLHAKEQAETPGPAHYDLPSSFDPEHSTSRPGFTNRYSGWMGERPPHTRSERHDGPGPGEYDPQAYEMIGSDLVGIGAAERAAHGMSSTEAARLGKFAAEGLDLGNGTPRRGATDYTEMNKAVERFKKELSLRFKSVYDAFSFFDINGDWAVTPAEFKQMLGKLGLHIPADQLDMVIRRLDVVRDGSIDPKEFVSSLRWHKRKGERPKDVEADMLKASRNREAIVKEAMQKKLELKIIESAKQQRGVASSSNSQPSQPTSPRSPRRPERPAVAPRPTRPLSARTDMRRGTSLGPRLFRVDHTTAMETPGPAGYLPYGAGEIGNTVGPGKDHLRSHEVSDSKCWAGSGLTTRAAFFGERTNAKFIQVGFTG